MSLTHHQRHGLSSHRFDVRYLGALPSLAVNRLLGFAASNIIGVFYPIFLYEFFGLDLHLVFYWYAIAMAIRIPLFVWAAKIFSRIGLVASMTIGTASWLIFYLSLFLLSVRPDLNPGALLALTMVSLAVLHAFYWAPWHVDFARFSTKGRRGHQIGLIYAIQLAVGMVAPVLGGFLIFTYSYGIVFIAGMLMVALSFIPLAFLPRTRVTYEFGFFETFRKMFSRRYRFLTWSMIAMGAEDMIGFLVWPIFLYAVFGGNYLDIGIFAGLIVIVSIILQFTLGAWLDKRSVKRFLWWGVDLYALGWVGKALVSSVGGVFAASTFHSFGSIMMRTPVDMLMYEKAADSGHYIDEFSVLREIALTMGRIASLFLLIGVTSFFSISASFILAALSTFGITLLVKYKVT